MNSVAWIMTDPGALAQNGEGFSCDRKPCSHVWKEARNPELGKRVIDETLTFLERWARAD